MPQFKEPYNIIICGVGGQGNILASSLVSLAATVAGCRVVVGETYGASQRGGSVMSHVRVSRVREYGPLIPLGRVDLIVGFEPLETLRVARQYANCDTVIIVNTTPVYPVSVVFNEASYPEVDNIMKALQNIADAVYSVDAVKLAREAGEPRAQNIVMINALSVCPGMPIKRSHFEEALFEFLKSNDREFRENNRRAFELPVSLQPLS
ncbi:MAG: indolepyruvate oxidoreductase subunit beta [Firmicutes bacterium]|nr:indolepyruvate oxidoreductase subunit beta [Bacillota bacterium]